MDRREALKLGALGAAIAAAGPLAALVLREDDEGGTPRPAPSSEKPFASPSASPSPSQEPTPTAETRGSDYGPIGPVADDATGEVLLWLPAGFRYHSLDWTGETMGDGQPVPPFPDGMGAFGQPDGTIRLVRNHEVFAKDWTGARVGAPDRAFDRGAGGGTTTLELAPDGRLVDSWASLGGTLGNCAGGVTPWGSWITCEETVFGRDTDDLRGDGDRLRRRHGYLFEVDAAERGQADAEPLRATGRFEHEAVAWPGDGYLYLTEDNQRAPSGFYRYRPPTPPERSGRLADGGALEMLAVDGAPDLSGEVPVGAEFEVDWVPIEDPDPRPGDRVPVAELEVAVSSQGIARGGTIFSRLEGCWAADGRVFFASTQGGAPVRPRPRGFGDGRGQLWALDVARGALTCIVAPTSADELAMPDNLTISSNGGLVVCEDRPPGQPQRLRGVDDRGRVFDLAQNAIEGHTDAEMAGVCFDPSGRWMFLNIQGDIGRRGGTPAPGVTVAIEGPWDEGPL